MKPSSVVSNGALAGGARGNVIQGAAWKGLGHEPFMEKGEALYTLLLAEMEGLSQQIQNLVNGQGL